MTWQEYDGHIALESLSFKAHDEVLGYLGVNGEPNTHRIAADDASHSLSHNAIIL